MRWRSGILNKHRQFTNKRKTAKREPETVAKFAALLTKRQQLIEHQLIS
jgi:hypothetical protein